jgi:hypothetical protein
MVSLTWWGTAQSGSERLFLCEKRLSNAQGRGICEANAGYAPRGMVCWWHDGSGISSIDKIGGVTQALLVEKGASNLQSKFLLGLGDERTFLNLLRRAIWADQKKLCGIYFWGHRSKDVGDRGFSISPCAAWLLDPRSFEKRRLKPKVHT